LAWRASCRDGFCCIASYRSVSYTSFDATLGGSFTTGFIRNGFKGGFNNGINTIKIDLGLFAADTDRGGWGWQILSRFTWQLPQTALGLTAAQGENTFGQVESVGYCEGATVVTKKVESAFFGQTTAYTLGSYIIGGNDLQANVRNPCFSMNMAIICKVRLQDGLIFLVLQFLAP
jgi:hypothetical protein